MTARLVIHGHQRATINKHDFHAERFTLKVGVWKSNVRGTAFLGFVIGMGGYKHLLP